jgi:hypothetical protein
MRKEEKTRDLAAGYQAMSEDKEREQEAAEWAEGLAGDIAQTEQSHDRRRSSWTYRVRKRTISAAEVEFDIVEYYTLSDGDSWTENSIAPLSLQPADAVNDANALDELRWHLTEMLKALDKPVLEDKD